MSKFIFIFSLLGLILFMPNSKPKEYIHDACSTPGKGAILISFNGYKPKTPMWNNKSFCSADLSIEKQEEILKEVKRIFCDWDVVVTTNEKLFYKFPINKRVRCVVVNDDIITYSRLRKTISKTISWGINLCNSFLVGDSTVPSNDLTESLFRKDYAGGIAIRNSLCKEDTIPALVSSYGMSFNTKFIARAICHEIGHMLGLYHQSNWIGIIRMEEYHRGDFLEAPIMGNSSSEGKKAVWAKDGINENWELQNEPKIISQTWTRIKYTY